MSIISFRGGAGRGSAVLTSRTEFPLTRNKLRDLALKPQESKGCEVNFPLFADAWSSSTRPQNIEHCMDNDLFVKGSKIGRGGETGERRH
jgi:hypothetical protein